MKYLSSKSVYFSPTGTTKKIICAIAQGLEIEQSKGVDLTLKQNNEEPIVFSKDEILIIGVPIYYGRVPKLVLDRISGLRGDNTPAIIVTVYGNAKVDDALSELKNVIESASFNVIAAATFIGEHSFSTTEKPIAINRPDKSDLEKATDFGKQIQVKLNNDVINMLAMDDKTPYNDVTPIDLGVPEVDETKCHNCKTCYSVCPTGAINVELGVKESDSSCILCCACIKSCPENARISTSDTMDEIRTKLHSVCKIRKEPELIL